MNDEPVFSPESSLGYHLSMGVRGRCPRCGKAKLFRKYLEVTDRCSVCGLDFSGHDAGDGPVVPVMLVVGGTIVGLVLWLELTVAPPLWAHAVIWLPAITISSMLVLPVVKGINIALQHRYRSTQSDH